MSDLAAKIKQSIKKHKDDLLLAGITAAVGLAALSSSLGVGEFNNQVHVNGFILPADSKVLDKAETQHAIYVLFDYEKDDYSGLNTMIGIAHDDGTQSGIDSMPVKFYSSEPYPSYLFELPGHYKISVINDRIGSILDYHQK